MHDDRNIVEARLARVVAERIQPAVRSARHPLEVEAWDVPGEPVPVAEALAADYRPFAIGSPWGRPWGTTWFRMAGSVPEDWVGQRVEAVLDLGFGVAPGFQAEGLLWVPAAGGVRPGPVRAAADGAGPGGRVEGEGWRAWRGLHPRNHSVPVADPAAGGEVVSFLIEAAANPSLVDHRPSPFSDLGTSGDAPIYALRSAHLVVVEPEVAALREDVRTLTDLMAALPLDQPRRHEILRALERMLDALVLDDVAASAPAARAELAEVLARPATASAHRISAIGHAHIDSAWLWPVRETRRKCARTFSNVLRLMEDYPEMRFACSQAQQYAWIEEDHPSLFADIADRVADGRWIPVGGMWVEPDVNLAGGEALVRQLVHGQRYFQDRFGVRCSEVWIPDVFGYSAALPQIMRLAGCTRLLTQKLSWNKTNPFPHHSFWWEGIDGSTVFTHFPPVDSYGSLLGQGELAHAVRNFRDKGRATRSVVPFGFGDGGGGPTRQMLEQYRRGRDLEGSPRLEIEAPSAFFDAAVEEYGPAAPRWVGELYFETHRGTYTSQAGTKAGNRGCEMLLREAELWCATAHGTRPDDGYPQADLDRLWKLVLLHQFHDILPGSGIAWVHREAEAAYAEVASELEAVIAAAVGHVAGGAAVVANAAPHDRDEVVLVDRSAAASDVDTARADGGSDDGGRSGGGALGAVPDRLGALGQVLSDGRLAIRLAAPAMAVVRLEPLPLAGEPVEVHERDGGIVLANGRLRVVVDEDGLLASVIDLEADREVLAPGERGNLLQLHPDLPTEYDAWDLDDFYRRQVTDLVAADSVEVLDRGPLVVRVAARRTFRSSVVEQVYELRAGSPRLEVVTHIDWHERDHVLKAAFPVDVHATEVTREIQFGHLRTPVHTNTSWDAARFEVCAHRWVDVSEAGYGVALLNDAKYGHDITRTRSATDRPTTTMRLTLLKGAQYPDPHADEGAHRFTYALLPHRGDLRSPGVTADVVAEGYGLNLPLRVVPGAAAAGSLPSAVVVVDHPDVVVEAVKAAEDGSGDLVVRLYEAAGARTTTAVTFGRPPVSVTVVDVLEAPRADLPDVDLVRRENGGVTLTLHPFQIATLRIAAA